jgi:spermidine/putrescine transport system substrate-binding protein
LKAKRPVRLIAALAVMVAAFALAACGGDLGGGANEDEVTTATAEGQASGDLFVSNWPFYIDSKSVPEFEQESGVTVDYKEDVNDNNAIFAKLQPSLQSGSSEGRDIIVVTDWMAKKMYDLGYLQNFDKAAIPEVNKNMLDSLQTPSFDPNRDFSAPWQSGMTGLIVNQKEAPGVDSINDIFDPQYKGKVTVLSELRDTIPLIMKGDGVDVETASTQDWLDAIDKLQGAVESGQIRDVTGNDYADDLARGDASIAVGWSGDAVQLQADNPDIEFVMPAEGCIIWSDNMVIPVGAPNPTAAYEFMDYVYTPENQAQIAAYNSYVTPVKGVQEIFEKTDPPLAKSELIFPTPEYQKDCSTQPNPPKDGEEEIQAAFEQLTTGG